MVEIYFIGVIVAIDSTLRFWQVILNQTLFYELDCIGESSFDC